MNNWTDRIMGTFTATPAYNEAMKLGKFHRKYEQFHGIPYRWRVSDCFCLANRIREYFNAPPLPNFDWVYEAWSEETFPKDQIAILLSQTCQPRIGAMQPLDLLCLRYRGGAMLATYLGDGLACWMGLSRSSVGEVERIGAAIVSVWHFSCD